MELESIIISVSTDSSQAAKGIDKLTDALSKLSQMSKNVKLNTVVSQLDKISEAAKRLETTKLQSLISGLSGLEKLRNLKISTNISNQLSKISEAAKSIDEGSLKNLRWLTDELVILSSLKINIGKEYSSAVENISSANTRIVSSNSKANASWLRTGAVTASVGIIINKAAGYLKEAFIESNDYVENLNLFNVAMGEYADSSKEYADKVKEVLGIDPSSWMRNQGLFKQITTGFGVVENKAQQMSKGLTQLGYDISSYFNIDIDEAMTKLQSGISGELEPLRRLGYALDAATLQEIAYANGIKQNINTMTQAQKSQLRYIAIMQQSENVMGDMARTVLTPANSVRILEQQLTQLKRAIGDIVSVIAVQVLPYLQAFVMLLTEIAQKLSAAMGFELPQIDYSDMDGLTGSASDADNAVAGVTDAVEDLKKATIGIDELNILSENSGLNSIADNFDLGIDLDQYDYDFLGGTANEKALQILEDMKAALEPIVRLLETIWDFANDHPTLVKAIGAVLLALIALKKILDGLNWLADATGLKSLVKGLRNLRNRSKNVTEEFTKKNKSLDEQTQKTYNDKRAVRELGESFKEASSPAKDFTKSLTQVKIPALPPASASFSYKVAVKGIETVKTQLMSFSSYIASIPKTISYKIQLTGIDAVMKRIQAFRQALPKGSSITYSVKLIGAEKALTQAKTLKAALPKGGSTMYNVKLLGAEKALTQAKTLQAALPKGGSITYTVNFVGMQTALTQLQAFRAMLPNNTYIIYAVMLQGVQTVLQELQTLNQLVSYSGGSIVYYVMLNGIDNVLTLLVRLQSMIKMLGGVVTYKVAVIGMEQVMQNLTMLQTIASLAGGNIMYTVNIIGITSAIAQINALSSSVTRFVGTSATFAIAGTVITSTCSAMTSSFITLAIAARTAAASINSVPVMGALSGVSSVAGYISGYASGGYPDEGQLFVAREAGPELVGSIGRRTAVANNDQIVQAVAAGVANAVASAGSGGATNVTGTFRIKGNDLVCVLDKENKRKGVTISNNFKNGGR